MDISLRLYCCLHIPPHHVKECKTSISTPSTPQTHLRTSYLKGPITNFKWISEKQKQNQDYTPVPPVRLYTRCSYKTINFSSLPLLFCFSHYVCLHRVSWTKVPLPVTTPCAKECFLFGLRYSFRLSGVWQQLQCSFDMRTAYSFHNFLKKKQKKKLGIQLWWCCFHNLEYMCNSYRFSVQKSIYINMSTVYTKDLNNECYAVCTVPFSIFPFGGTYASRLLCVDHRYLKGATFRICCQNGLV